MKEDDYDMFCKSVDLVDGGPYLRISKTIARCAIDQLILILGEFSPRRAQAMPRLFCNWSASSRQLRRDTMHVWQSRVCTLLHRVSPGSQVPWTPSTWRLVNLPLTTRLRKAFSQAKLEKAHVAQYSHPCQPRPILSLTRHRSCGVTMCRVDSASRIHRRRTSSAQPLTCLKHRESRPMLYNTNLITM